MRYAPGVTYRILTERKRDQVARMSAAVEELARDLAAFAREHRGRFVLFGSAARGEMRFDSDVDIMADFEPDVVWDAVGYAADRAAHLGLRPDVLPRGLSGRPLLDRIAVEGRVIE